MYSSLYFVMAFSHQLMTLGMSGSRCVPRPPMAPPGHQLLEIQSTKHASGRSDRAQTGGCGRIEAIDHMTTAAQRSTKQNAHIVVMRRFDVRHAEQTRSKWSILVKGN